MADEYLPIRKDSSQTRAVIASCWRKVTQVVAFVDLIYTSFVVVYLIFYSVVAIICTNTDTTPEEEVKNLQGTYCIREIFLRHYAKQSNFLVWVRYVYVGVVHFIPPFAAFFLLQATSMRPCCSLRYRLRRVKLWIWCSLAYVFHWVALRLFESFYLGYKGWYIMGFSILLPRLLFLPVALKYARIISESMRKQNKSVNQPEEVMVITNP